MKKFSERLLEAIQSRNFTQAMLARAVAKSETYISLLCTGKRVPPPILALSIAEALNVSYYWLSEGEGKVSDPFDSTKFYDASLDLDAIDKARISVKRMPEGACHLTFKLTSRERVAVMAALMM